MAYGLPRAVGFWIIMNKAAYFYIKIS